MNITNITNYTQRLIVTTLAALLLSSVPLSFAQATTQTSAKNGIAMSPAKKKYDYDAGTTSRDTLKVTNVGNITYTVKMYTEPYSVKDENYETDFQTIKKNTDLQSWVSFDKVSYVLAPGQSVDVGYTVKVPAEAAPGGHYGVIFAETVPEKGANDSTALVGRNRVGAPIFATVKGDYRLGGKFTGTQTPALQFQPPLKSDVKVENTGNSHFTVDTVFAVFDLLGNRKFTNTGQYEVLPQSIRKIPLQWSTSPGFGLFKVTTSAKFLDQQTTKTTYVLMAPLAYYMIFGIGLLVAIISFVAKRR